MIIQDGTGSGNQLRINDLNHLEADAVTYTRIADVSLRTKQAFTIATNFVNITTTASFSGLLYIKNTDSEGRDMLIEHIRLCGDGGAGAMNMESIKCIVYRNPTTGTLISGGTTLDVLNNNFGSFNEFNGVAKVGADGLTVTDGGHFTQFETHTPGHSILDFNDSIVLPKNSSIAFAVQPTIAGDICMEVNVHFE